MAKSISYNDIQRGDRIVVLVPGGKRLNGEIDWIERTGRAVMRGPAGWVLDMGGPHGWAAVCTPDKFVRASRPTKRNR